MNEADKPIEVDDVAAKAVVGTFQCNMQISASRTITITGHLYDNDTAEQINRRVDAYQDALARQYLRCDIENKELQKKQHLAGLEQYIENLEDLKARQDGKPVGLSATDPRPAKLSSQQKEAIRNADATKRKIMETIEKLDSEIDEGRRKLGMPSA